MCIEMIRRILLGGLLASAIFAHLAESHAGRPAPVAPWADHHAHIWSLKASELATDPLLPPVELPPDLAKLLKDREELVKSKDAAIMASLYTEDAMVLDAMAPTWLKGKDAIDFIATSMSS